MLHGVVGFGCDGHEDGLGGVLEKRCSVLSLSLLHPVPVDLEGARVNELADGFDGVGVALEHLLGDGFGPSVIAVDSHGGQDGQADDLWKSLRGRSHSFNEAFAVTVVSQLSRFGYHWTSFSVFGHVDILL